MNLTSCRTRYESQSSSFPHSRIINHGPNLSLGQSGGGNRSTERFGVQGLPWRGILCMSQTNSEAASSVEFQPTSWTLNTLFPRHPYHQRSVKLKPYYNGYAREMSTWRAPDNVGTCDLQPFQRTYSAPVPAHRPIPVSVEPSPDRFPTWFSSEQDRLGILTLARA
ncbi:hypothetical protein B0J18DRAFT_231922 [Chaetomium sp. MPI-SDFR-AT-0129]|nr:hypothetical protein B0J18DRAFT_231922 [Chaetomium sp. MPI-SDFR-AT-0129]